MRVYAKEREKEILKLVEKADKRDISIVTNNLLVLPYARSNNNIAGQAISALREQNISLEIV